MLSWEVGPQCESHSPFRSRQPVGGQVAYGPLSLNEYLDATIGVHEKTRSAIADRAIDYATTDFSAEGARYAIVADCVGKATFAQCRRATKRGGAILQVAPTLGAMMSGIFASGGRQVVAGVATGKSGDLAVLAEIAAQGTFRPPIEQVFPLGEIVEAHRHSESGRKVGHVVVAMD